MGLRGSRGQSISDYAIAVTAIAVTMGAMQPFMQRMVQARIKDTTDGMFATEAPDAPDFTSKIMNADRNQWGMDTQRKGIDRRKAGTGLDDGNIVGDFSTAVAIELEEGVASGRYGVTYASNTRVSSGRAHFEGTRPAPPQSPVKMGTWFRTESQREGAREFRKQRREHERQYGQRQQNKSQDWERIKEEARACYADPACRAIFTDQDTYRAFATTWNSRFGKTLKQQQKKNWYYLDPEGDPAAAFKAWYGVPLEGGADGWSGDAYAYRPAGFGGPIPYGPKQLRKYAQRNPIALWSATYGKPTDHVPGAPPPPGMKLP